MPAPPTGAAELNEILDKMAATALADPGLIALGIKQTYGSEIPETWNGVNYTMLFWARKDGGDVTPYGQGRTSYGQRIEDHRVQGCLIVGTRDESLDVLLKRAYPWVRDVFDAFWLHQQLGGYVQMLRPEGYRFDTLPWGDFECFCILFDWTAETRVTAPRGL